MNKRLKNISIVISLYVAAFVIGWFAPPVFGDSAHIQLEKGKLDVNLSGNKTLPTIHATNSTVHVGGFMFDNASSATMTMSINNNHQQQQQQQQQPTIQQFILPAAPSTSKQKGLQGGAFLGSYQNSTVEAKQVLLQILNQSGTLMSCHKTQFVGPCWDPAYGRIHE